MEGKEGDIGRELRNVLAGLCEKGIEAGRIADRQRIREDLGFDSVAVMDLMIELESRFKVYFDPYEHDLPQIFRTVGSIDRFLAAARAQGGHGRR